MKRLAGKKVWIIQYDDEDNSVIGIVEGIDNGFIALRMEHEAEPTLYVNLTNVKEIEVFRERGEGELRLLRFPQGEIEESEMIEIVRENLMNPDGPRGDADAEQN